ncbi:MAG: DEAD/DEAH box helicase [Pseudomonadota bacterium]
MSLNPVQFGSEVIDQFGRYLLTTFPIADEAMEKQVKEHLRHDVGGERLIAKGPYVYLNRPFEQGPSVKSLAGEPGLGLHPALAGVFPYESVHKHQELALRSVKAGKHTVVATGTGSGKTEAFLLPIIDHCLHLRDAGAAPGVVAILVYPMNALADDQLRRLRPMLAGTGITFGRYTGMTPESDKPTQGQLNASRAYTKEELGRLSEGDEESVPIPAEECWSRDDIRTRRPRLLISNYSQLEYLLLRHRDLGLFQDAPLRFLVFDEVHTYTGALGSEVACLIRRLRRVARKGADDVVCIGTSATVQDRSGKIDAEAATKGFASRLFGVVGDAIELVRERYRDAAPAGADDYVPPVPPDARGVLKRILDEARRYRLQESVEDLSGDLVDLVAVLCGRPAPFAATRMEQAWTLLQPNRLLRHLEQTLTDPRLLSEALTAVRTMGREEQEEEALTAEVLAYLTLGALVKHDDEPLLRPKLHYFVQGFQGLSCAFEEDGTPTVYFDSDATRGDADPMLFPMVLCRSCGQHYVQLIASERVRDGDVGVEKTRIAGRYEEAADHETMVYLTDHLVGRDEDDDQEVHDGFLCRYCGTLHDRIVATCRNPKCARKGVVAVVRHDNRMKSCLACGTPATGWDEIVTPAQSSEVADVTILSQSMLTAMQEEELQKLLVFSDNRQDAAFQAGWMEERSKRFRLRHLLYEILQKEPGKTWSFEKLAERIVEAAEIQGVFRAKAWDPEDNETRARWFLLQEFASSGQRRNSIESLALAEVVIANLGTDLAPEFFQKWARTFDLTEQQVVDIVRLMLDCYRRQGMVSDPLLSRLWSSRDNEVRKGLVLVSDTYYPRAVAEEKSEKSSYLKAWRAGNHRSAAQVILQRAVPGASDVFKKIRNDFMDELWALLRSQRLIVPVRLTRKHGAKQEPIQLPGKPYHINVELLGIRLVEKHHVCDACRRSQSVPTPTGACPEYQCSGTLHPRDRDPDHFDVYQYTRTSFVPLKAAEHSAQVPGDDRRRIEEEFKKQVGGRYNCLVCTPTLELGVDIGKLEMTLMRNVPPTPANYAQRAGRAGRRHRIAVVFTYCRSSTHDRYFFGDPRAMIAGEIRVPAFSMRNEPLIRKHVHSEVLTSLRELVTEEEQEALDRAFPPFVHFYFGDEVSDGDKVRIHYLDAPRDTSALDALVKKYRTPLIEALEVTFLRTWPDEEERDALLGRDALERYVGAFGEDLRAHVRKLFDQVKTYREALKDLRRKADVRELDDQEQNLLRRYEHALWALRNFKRQENYTLSFLAVDGFFPGYAMARQSVSCQSLEPYLEISRPAPVALRELTPANFVYANGNVFRVRKLDLTRGSGADAATASATLQRRLRYDKANTRIIDIDEGVVEGGASSDVVEMTSFTLTGVEMQRRNEIDDSEKQRRRIAFEVLAQPLAAHGGGRHGKIGDLTIKYLTQQSLRLVNLGVRKASESGFSGFPICAHCGEARSPNASEGEILRFSESHQQLHGRQTIGHYALHVEFRSDALHVGPFASSEKAVNLVNGLIVGARLVLDMGETELEGHLYRSTTGEYWTLLYDPMPGGSGFLPLLLEYWEVICEKARDALDHCASGCETACYSCLKHFRNQQWHDVLDRHLAMDLLLGVTLPLELEHSIPPVALQPAIDPDGSDSDAELDFATICKNRSFPVPPTKQFRVDLPGGEHTLADWAYPDQKVLVFIDGMSEEYHGNPAQRAADRVKRAKCRLQGYSVVEITREELQDSSALAYKLEEIAIYLGALDSSGPSTGE